MKNEELYSQLKTEIFKQLVGKLNNKGGNYFANLWNYAEEILNDCSGGIEENSDGYNYYEVSQFDTKNGQPLQIEWKRGELK